MRTPLWFLSTLGIFAIGLVGSIAAGLAYSAGYRAGQVNMRDTILCVTAHSMGHTYSIEAHRQCNKLGTPIAPLIKRKTK